ITFPRAAFHRHVIRAQQTTDRKPVLSVKFTKPLSTRARTHTHTHTHTQREREREREKHTCTVHTLTLLVDVVWKVIKGQLGNTCKPSCFLLWILTHIRPAQHSDGTG